MSDRRASSSIVLFNSLMKTIINILSVTRNCYTILKQFSGKIQDFDYSSNSKVLEVNININPTAYILKDEPENLSLEKVFNLKRNYVRSCLQ